MWHDPIVEETRRDAEKLAAIVDFDQTRFIDRLRNNQLKSKSKLVSFSKKRLPVKKDTK